MIQWQQDWQPFDAPEKASYFLLELNREIQENPEHLLYGKKAKIVGWIPGNDDFLLHLPLENVYAYVHLTWHREDKSQWPHCQLLASIDAVTRFVGQRD